MFDSITKKVTYIQVLVVIVAMVGFITYISNYLSNYIEKETRVKLDANAQRMVQTIDTYNGALEGSVVKLYNIFKENYFGFYYSIGFI